MSDQLLRLYLALYLLGYTSGYLHVTVCYGDIYILPKYLCPPLFKRQIYYTPTGGVKRLVVNNGKSLDPLFKVSYSEITMGGLTHEEQGAISAPSATEVIAISIDNCEEPVIKKYGESFSWELPQLVEFVQFVSSDTSEEVVLWNRTNLNKSRGDMDGTVYSIFELKQPDSGYYKFRGSPLSKLLHWTRLQVKGRIGWIIGTIAVIVVLALICCCCIRTYRAKKKQSEPAPQPIPELAPALNPALDQRHPAPAPSAAPALYYYDMTIIQPSGTVNPPTIYSPANAPTTNPSELPSYESVICDGNPTLQFPVTLDVGSSAAAPEPQFHIRGTCFPSAPSFDADTSTSHVYNSEKMNFL